MHALNLFNFPGHLWRIAREWLWTNVRHPAFHGKYTSLINIANEHGDLGDSGPAPGAYFWSAALSTALERVGGWCYDPALHLIDTQTLAT